MGNRWKLSALREPPDFKPRACNFKHGPAGADAENSLPAGTACAAPMPALLASFGGRTQAGRVPQSARWCSGLAVAWLLADVDCSHRCALRILHLCSRGTLIGRGWVLLSYAEPTVTDSPAAQSILVVQSAGGLHCRQWATEATTRATRTAQTRRIGRFGSGLRVLWMGPLCPCLCWLPWPAMHQQRRPPQHAALAGSVCWVFLLAGV